MTVVSKEGTTPKLRRQTCQRSRTVPKNRRSHGCHPAQGPLGCSRCRQQDTTFQVSGLAPSLLLDNIEGDAESCPRPAGTGPARSECLLLSFQLPSWDPRPSRGTRLTRSRTSPRTVSPIKKETKSKCDLLHLISINCSPQRPGEVPVEQFGGRPSGVARLSSAPFPAKPLLCSA